MQRLGTAHGGLLDTIVRDVSAPVQVSRKQQVENFLSNHRGIISVIAIFVAIAFGLLKLFHG